MFLHLKGNRMHECKNEWYWKEKVSSSSIQHQTNWKSVSSTKAKDKKKYCCIHGFWIYIGGGGDGYILSTFY